MTLFRYVLMIVVCVATAQNFAARAESDLQQRATWTAPTVAEVKSQLDGWLADIDASPAARSKVQALWSDEGAPSGIDLLERLADSIALVHPEARQVVTLCGQPQRPLELPYFPLLGDEAVPNLVRNNLRLLYGRWLAVQQLYNEAQEQLTDLAPEDVVDPASLLFYQGVVYHRLLDKEKCLPHVSRLLENESTLPRRYVAVARLLEADIRPLKEDSLDEIARLMDNIRVRLDHGRAGKRVRKEEDDVIAKLDKMIEELEKQCQQCQSGSGGQLQPSSPMQDSMPGGGTGPGNVDPKRIGNQDDWGNLPPKERQEALQQLGKEFPSHYREVIEEYFRKLARDAVPPVQSP